MSKVSYVEMAAAGGNDHGTAEEAFVFRPDGEELINKFLRPKMAGEPLPPSAQFIHDADVCLIHPGELAATHAPAPGPEGAEPVWYFFSPVHYYYGTRHTRYARRIIGKGYWMIDHHRSQLVEENGWYRRRFGFLDCSLFTPNGARSPPKWLMVEYGTTEEAGQQQLVLCEVFRAPPKRF